MKQVIKQAVINASMIAKGRGVKFNVSRILKLGIQAVPGFYFYLDEDKKCKVYIGYTGIYDAEFENKIIANYLEFPSDSIELMRDSSCEKIIVDLILEEEDTKEDNNDDLWESK